MELPLLFVFYSDPIVLHYVFFVLQKDFYQGPCAQLSGNSGRTWGVIGGTWRTLRGHPVSPSGLVYQPYQPCKAWRFGTWKKTPEKCFRVAGSTGSWTPWSFHVTCGKLSLEAGLSKKENNSKPSSDSWGYSEIFWICWQLLTPACEICLNHKMWSLLQAPWQPYAGGVRIYLWNTLAEIKYTLGDWWMDSDLIVKSLLGVCKCTSLKNAICDGLRLSTKGGNQFSFNYHSISFNIHHFSLYPLIPLLAVGHSVGPGTKSWLRIWHAHGLDGAILAIRWGNKHTDWVSALDSLICLANYFPFLFSLHSLYLFVKALIGYCHVMDCFLCIRAWTPISKEFVPQTSKEDKTDAKEKTEGQKVAKEDSFLSASWDHKLMLWDLTTMKLAYTAIESNCMAIRAFRITFPDTRYMQKRTHNKYI